MEPIFFPFLHLNSPSMPITICLKFISYFQGICNLVLFFAKLKFKINLFHRIVGQSLNEFHNMFSIQFSSSASEATSFAFVSVSTSDIPSNVFIYRLPSTTLALASMLFVSKVACWKFEDQPYVE